jgi:hypothetical protein
MHASRRSLPIFSVRAPLPPITPPIAAIHSGQRDGRERPAKRIDKERAGASVGWQHSLQHRRGIAEVLTVQDGVTNNHHHITGEIVTLPHKRKDGVRRVGLETVLPIIPE